MFIGQCARIAWTAEVNMGEPGSPTPPPAGGPHPQAEVWGNRVSPDPHPREGLGGQSPPRRTLLSPCGCGPEARAPGPRATGGSGRAKPSQERPVFIPSVCGAAAWMANVNTVRRVQPPSQPPPAGGRSRVPAPGGRGSGRGPAPCPRSRGAGVPPALPGRVHRAGCAMRTTISRDHGGTRFPHTPTGGRRHAGSPYAG